MNWEINLINNLGYGFNIDSKKFSNTLKKKILNIKLDNVDYKIPSFLVLKILIILISKIFIMG